MVGIGFVGLFIDLGLGNPPDYRFEGGCQGGRPNYMPVLVKLTAGVALDEAGVATLR